MYNAKDIQFVGKHDYDKEKSTLMADCRSFTTFSIGIFQWNLKKSGKSMKRGNVIVRVHSSSLLKDHAFEIAENIVLDLDKGEWDGRKNVYIDNKML